ncbi:MAG: 3-deoxy-D-manno-octulosonic acid transferase, partial [Flavobacteriales bacterium]
VMEIAKTAQSIPEIESFKGAEKLIVCGSTWPEDERLLVEAIQTLPNVKWVIAPHEVGEGNIKRLERLFPNSVRLSALSNREVKVVLVDSIGQLNRLYNYAGVAYVGGAFKTGLHNILEATAYGVPTIFGPYYSRFPDAGEMAEKELAFSVSNQSELNDKLRGLLGQDQVTLKKGILDFMKSRTGATTAILQYTNKC